MRGALQARANDVGGIARTLSYQYDRDSDRTRLTFPDSQYVSFDYDGLDRMTVAKESGTTAIATIAYNSQGQRASLAGGGTTTYGYDSIGRLSSLAIDLSGTGQDVTYGFTGYNPASQLITRTIGNDAYIYDSYANGTRVYAVNGLNQYTAVAGETYAHDANGNLTDDGPSNYSYDVENRLLTSSAGSGGSLTYDPMGRLSTAAGASTTRMLYDGDALVAEYDNAGTLLRRYVHGPGVDEPLIWYEGSTLAQRRRLYANHQGSVVAVSDASGASIAINAYDEYGAPKPGNIGRFAYTGQIALTELGASSGGGKGLYHYKARAYAPAIGRFMQTDPVAYEDQINLYAYVGSDPINMSDSSGNDGIWVNGPNGQQTLIIPVRFIGDASLTSSVKEQILARANGLQIEGSAKLMVVEVTSKLEGVRNTLTYQSGYNTKMCGRVGECTNRLGGNKIHINSDLPFSIEAAVHDLVLHTVGIDDTYIPNRSLPNGQQIGPNSDDLTKSRLGTRISAGNMATAKNSPTTKKIDRSSPWSIEGDTITGCRANASLLMEETTC